MADEETLGGDYVLHEQLGRGAIGVVRRATRKDGGPPLAAKLLRADLADDRLVRNMFLQEEAVLRNLQHESIVSVRDLVFERGKLALLMDYVDGPNLRGYLASRGGTLPPAEACAIAAQAAAALAAAHAQGIVHLDLKPENILVERDTHPVHIKITDFSVSAHPLDAGRDQASLGGTAGYTAPEALGGGALTAAADVYALGVILVEMLTGVRPDPTAGANAAIPLAEPLRRLVYECLAPDPPDRPNARTVHLRLLAAAGALVDTPAHAPSTPPGPEELTRLRGAGRPQPDPVAEPQPATRKPKGPVLTLLAGMATAIVVLALGMYATPKTATPDRTAPNPAAVPVVVPTSPPAPPTPAAAVQIRATYSGHVKGGGATIAIAVRDGVAIAYLCDGRRVEAWLLGTAAEGKLTLTSPHGATLTGTFDEATAAGSVTAGRRQWEFTVPAVQPPSGLYRASAKVNGATIVGGWIILSDGSQVGVVTTNGTQAPAPPLNTVTGRTKVGRTSVEAAPIDATTGSGF